MSFSFIDSIGIENALNSILVNEGIRPAMLIQEGDYDEDIGIEMVKKTIIEQFPDLKASDNYSYNQGVIISKTDYNGRQNISLNEMGKILGYPCYEGFDLNNRFNTSVYAVNVFVHLEYKGENDWVELFTNICNDEKMIEQFKRLSKRAKEVFMLPEYKNGLLKDVHVERVEVVTRRIPSPKSIIDKLTKGYTLDVDEKNEILGEFNRTLYANSSHENPYESMWSRLQKNVQYDNPKHKPILIKLLSKLEKKEKYDDIVSDVETMENTKILRGGNKKHKLKKMRSSKRKTKHSSKKKTYTKRRRSAKSKTNFNL